jgi:thioredoxin-related protein
MVQIDAEKQEKVAAKYKVDGYPTTIILKPNGAGVARFEKEMNAQQFLSFMRSKYAAAKK